MDASSNGFHGIAVNCQPATDRLGVTNGALYMAGFEYDHSPSSRPLTGFGSYVLCGEIGWPSNVSLCAWIKPMGARKMEFIQHRPDDARYTAAGERIICNPSSGCRMKLNYSFSSTSLTSCIEFSLQTNDCPYWPVNVSCATNLHADGLWHHLCMTYDGAVFATISSRVCSV
jgi:hypothetical protein